MDAAKIAKIAKSLSEHALRLLDVIDGSSGSDGSFWIPPSGLKQSWSTRFHNPVFVDGPKSASALKALERRGLIRFMPLCDYASQITEDGRILCEHLDAEGWPFT